jgi:hypothetical protein
VGTLHYGSEEFSFEDQLLAHLQVVITLKLRRGEPFFLSWATDILHGSGRHAVWLSTPTPIHIEYSGNRAPGINRDWIESLVVAANSSSGLVVTKEGAAPID